MEEKLSVLFMGTPDFAVGILEKIAVQNHHLCGVVTAPDKEAGRGRKKKESAVKKWATLQGLPVYQPTNLKSDEFNEQLRELNPDVIIVVAFRMLPKKVWNFPPRGTINLHASLLPDYRGAAPVHWAIINGENKTGVTTFFIDEAIDTGKIIQCKETAIHENDDVAALHDKLMHLGAELVVETLNLVKIGNFTTTDQKLSASDKKAPKLDKYSAKINWHQTQQILYNFIRGLSPFPCSWSYMNDGQTTCKVFKTTKTDIPSTSQPGSMIIKEKAIYVATRDKDLQLEEIQLQNKKRMTAQEAINGNLIKSGDVLT